MLSISENTALFSLFATTYGGDGKTTFALPDLRGIVPAGVSREHYLGDVLPGSLPIAPSPGSVKLGVLSVNWCIATTGSYPRRSD